MIISFYADFEGKQIYKKFSERLAASLSELKIPYDIEQLQTVNENWSDTCRQKPQFILDKLLQHKKPVVWVDVDSVVSGDIPDVKEPYDIACPKSVNQGSYYFVESGLIYVNYTEKAIEFLKAWIEAAKSVTRRGGDHIFLIDTWIKFSKERKDVKLLELNSEFSNRGKDAVVKIVETIYPEKIRERVRNKLTNASGGKKYYDTYWWNTIPNFGDWIGPYLFTRSNCVPVHRGPKMSDKYLTCGSVIQNGSDTDVVWGSGILFEKNPIPTKANYLAVRGPRTRDLIIKAGGQCPEVYGDPALLLPLLIEPSAKDTLIGVIPHHSEMIHFKNKTFPGVKIIDPRTNNVEKIVREITSCKYIVASSLHGIIVANAYNIPVAWVHFTESMAKQAFKYDDYFESIGYSQEKPLYVNVYKNQIDFKEIVKKRGIKYHVGLNLSDLIDACPFKLNVKKED